MVGKTLSELKKEDPTEIGQDQVIEKVFCNIIMSSQICEDSVMGKRNLANFLLSDINRVKTLNKTLLIILTDLIMLLYNHYL